MAPNFFFFTLLLLLSTQIQARDSYFFGKFRRDNTNNNNVVPVEETTNPIPQNTQPQDQDPTFIPDSNNGYGLYSHDTDSSSYNTKYDDKFNSKTEEDSTYNNNNKFNSKPFSTPSLTETEEDSVYNNNKFNTKTEEDSVYNNKFNTKTFSTPSLTETEEDPIYNNKYDEKYPKETYQNDNSYNNNNKFNTKTFSTPSLTETEEDSVYNNKYDQKYPKETYQNDNSYNNNNDKYENTNSYENNNEKDLYKSNAYGEELEGERGYKGYTSHNLEREGMSDTRFMEKGKYYYDVYNPRNHGHFYQKTRPSSSYSPAGFKDSYDSKWEKEQEKELVPEEFQEEQVDRFNP